MTRLALLAVLLLALSPSLSRVLSGASSQVLAGWSELCTSTGLKWMSIETGDFSGAAAPQPAMPAGAGHCDYCPLAASLTLLVLFLAFLLPFRSDGPAPAWSAPRLRKPANLRGLGGQGPPILL